jgi:hypothetical protein
MHMKIIATLAIVGTALAVASPAAAHDKAKRISAVYDDSNSHYLDYKTDISEAKRELRKDLARANDEGDRIDAWHEYRREVADARYDFQKEMAERGVIVSRKGLVRVEE